MFWCCCGTQPEPVSPLGWFGWGTANNFVNTTNNQLVGPFGWVTAMQVNPLSGAVDRNGIGTLGSQWGTPVSNVRSIEYYWSVVMFYVPLTIGQSVTAASLHFQDPSGGPGGTLPYTNPNFTVVGYLSRKNYELSGLDFVPNPFPAGFDLKPWPVGTYGGVPTNWNDKGPWITPAFNATVNALSWSINVTTQMQTFAAAMTVDNPIAMFLVYTTYPMSSGRIVNIGPNTDITPELIPNYLSVTTA